MFENHISDQDGVWRLHDKVYPASTQPKQSVLRHELLEGLPEADRPDKPSKLALRIEQRIEEENKSSEKKRKDYGSGTAPEAQ